MTIFYLIIYTIAIYGFCNVMVFGGGPFDMLTKFRVMLASIHPTFADLMSCMMCFPTLVGLCVAGLNMLLLPSLPMTPFFQYIGNLDYWYVILVGDMFYASGVVWLINTFQEAYERFWANNDEGEEIVLND